MPLDGDIKPVLLTAFRDSEGMRPSNAGLVTSSSDVFIQTTEQTRRVQGPSQQNAHSSIYVNTN